MQELNLTYSHLAFSTLTSWNCWLVYILHLPLPCHQCQEADSIGCPAKFGIYKCKALVAGDQSTATVRGSSSSATQLPQQN